MKILRSRTFEVLKCLYRDELNFIADTLSQDRTKWRYDKRSKSSVKRAIISNAEEAELVRVLDESWGTRMSSGNTFPRALQVRKAVFGPLGFLKSILKRSRYEAEAVADIFTKYVKSNNLLAKLVKNYQGKIPKDVLQLIEGKKDFVNKSMLIQLVLAYLNDKEICGLVNDLLEQGNIKIDIAGLYENIEDFWIITRYGLILIPEDDPINNIAQLVKKHYEWEDLEPELKSFSGDHPTKLLEYCITESPEVILRRLFGLPTLRGIAKKLGLVSEKMESTDEVVALILLALGFAVPPTLTGASTYLANIQKLKRDFSESHDTLWRSGIMSRIFVELERVSRDLAYFHTCFLWNEQLDDLESDIEKEKPEFTSRQVKIKTIDVFIRKKFRIRKPFERLGFGDLIGFIRSVNKVAQKTKSLKKKMSKSFGRAWILETKGMKLLEGVSPYRSSFTHAKDYPGDEKCEEIIHLAEEFLRDVRSRKIYPLVMRISREVSDEYGKSYAECVDENGNRWLLYTEEYLDTSTPYFVHSKTTNIAVNPIVVEKIF